MKHQNYSKIILGGTSADASADASGDNSEHTLNVSTSVNILQIVEPGLVWWLNRVIRTRFQPIVRLFWSLLSYF